MIHVNLIQGFSFILISISTTVACSQIITLPNAYAHNDYWHKRPLQDALENGFTYIEADIYLRNDKLIVAHILPWFKKNRTLEELYLNPLLDYINNNDCTNSQLNNNQITLVIDIKSDADRTYKKLLLVLENYRSVLSAYENGRLIIRKLSVVITGNRPIKLLSATTNHLVFIDENLKQTGNDSASNIYPIASCKYSSLLRWKGTGILPEKERLNLQFYVNRAHRYGRKVRLWASPENATVWSELLKCKVDLINTDKLVALKNFLISDMYFIAGDR